MRAHPVEVYPEGAEAENPEDILVHALGLACTNNWKSQTFWYGAGRTSTGPGASMNPFPS